MKLKEPLLDCGEIRPRRRNFVAAIQRETNIKCLILTLILSGCLVTSVIWCSRTTNVTKVNFSAFPIVTTREVSPCDDGFAYIPAAFIITLYFVYLVECWHSKAREMLSLPKIDVNTVYRKVHQMRQAKPIVWWKAVCYHYVRQNQFQRCDTNRNAFTNSKRVRPGESDQIYRVNSHTATSLFSYFMCGVKDISRDLVDLEKFAVTKLRFKKGFIFSNSATSTEFQDQRAIFFQEQEEWDDYLEMKEGLDLANVSFTEQAISWASPEDLPWFGRTKIFWLCSFFLLSWPLRIILELNTAHVNYQVTKLFGTNYMSPLPQLPTSDLYASPNSYSFFSESLYKNHGMTAVVSDIQPHQWWRRTVWLSHLVHPFKNHQRLGQRGGDSSSYNGLLEDEAEEQDEILFSSSSPSHLQGHDSSVRQISSPSSLLPEMEGVSNGVGQVGLPLLPNGRKKYNGMWSPHVNVHLGDTIETINDEMTVKNWGMGCGWHHDVDTTTHFPRSVTLLMTEPVHHRQGGGEDSGEDESVGRHRHSDEFGGERGRGGCNLVPSYSQALLLMNEEGRRRRETVNRVMTDGSDGGGSEWNGRDDGESCDNYGLANTLLTTQTIVNVAPPPPASSWGIDSEEPESCHRPHHNVDEPFLQVERLGPQPFTNSCNEPREGRIPMPTSATSQSLSSSSLPSQSHPTVLRSFSVSNFQPFSRPPRSDSFRALSAVMPRATGIEIDLTHPVSASVPPDPLGSSNSNSNSTQLMMLMTRNGGQGEGQGEEIESPPNYIEALRTSRPVSLPPWTRLRRCFTEKNLNSSASSQHYKCRRPIWLQDVRPTFLLNPHHPQPNRPHPNSSTKSTPVQL